MNASRRRVCFVVGLFGLLGFGCSTAGGGDLGTGPGPGNDGAVQDDASGADVPSASACPPCVTASDCAGGSQCAQFGSDIYCAPSCTTAKDCSADRDCLTVPSATGDQVNVCVPRGDVCGASVGPMPDAGTGDATTATDAGSSTTCGTLVSPDTKAACKCDPTLHTCQPNGCYGGWWCDTATLKCHAAPTTPCGTADAGPPPPPVDAGPPGTITAAGGSLNRLLFAVVGDTRPPTDDDTAGYPTAVITKIYQDIAALSPMPPFVVSTGDYMFAKAFGTQSGPQLDLYMGARAKYPGVEFPAMGNHECTGAVTSNCGSGNPDGITNNYTSFMNKMLAPIGQSKPWYEIDIHDTAGKWTSKFLFIAGNAWTSEEASWFDAAMAKPTTYTFVVRHEPAAANTAPGVTPSETIMKAHPYTLALVGHTHTYGKTGARQVTIGNGGAPLVGTGNFGFALLQQRTDGAIQVDMIDYATGATDPAFRFAVKPDGSLAP